MKESKSINLAHLLILCKTLYRQIHSFIFCLQLRLQSSGRDEKVGQRFGVPQNLK